MKKYFYLAAVSAMMLTACSSENDVVQPTTAQPTNPVAVQQQAVAFDTYLAGSTASTRSGEKGVMTTQKLKTATAGFGVFTFYSDNGNYNNTTAKPDFMYNQKVTWNSGWTYSPLKYWPNETTADMYNETGHATSTATDKLSFFAYAPYVDPNISGGLVTPGITALSGNNVAGDPTVSWTYSQSPDNNVDLLWGVAPAGFSYTNVSGATTSVPVGMPLLNLVKPDKDQKVKFLFQHALSRIGLSVVSAIDQIAAGDDAGKYTTDETRVLIEEVKIWGNFGQSGVLNLNNTEANVANWIEANVTRTATDETTPSFTINASNGPLAPSLRYVGTQISAITGTVGDASDGDASKFADLNTGVLPSEQPLLAGAIDENKAVSGTPGTAPTFAFGKSYYIADGTNCVIATANTANNVKVYRKDASGNYTLVYNAPGTGTGYAVDGTETNLVMLTGDDTAINAGTTPISSAADYWTLNTTTNVFEKHHGTISTGNYYTLAEASFSATYANVKYYSAPLPRYYMVVPSALPASEGNKTEVNVKITYHVVTKDAKLTDKISDISNAITKQTKIQLENGKSYNLKLILGLTSVKLDATVADWLVADETEINLPQNAE